MERQLVIDVGYGFSSAATRKKFFACDPKEVLGCHHVVVRSLVK